MAEDELNDKLESLLTFVAMDDNDFDPEAFMKEWPADPAQQRTALGLLTMRNSRELAKLGKGYPRLWITVSLALALSVASFSLSAGIDILPSLGGAIVAGLVGIGLKQL